ncbi:efflux RND transporter periplasmic adaptor subunit [Acidobacteria bacterium ACD]|nr:MAG: efflux RND transporter periplasmic adaptor subunit [Acidobacteriota bacterium]MCE7957152.1 efflux RND transporter periplasmic adaptor subunit [Acidobacteria bacterium ACB2]MDL1948871.1 efflux RND transporter periplasmic adaptor subunit [Acidobacteria bacterium ACD]
MGKLFRILIGLLALGGVAVALYAWASAGKKGDGLKLVEAEKGSITEKALAVGQIQPRQKFQVKSKISGIVKVCRVEVGDRVKTGDPLFEIQPDPTPLEVTEVDRRVESARATFERAKADFSRSEELFRQGIVPKSDTDSKRESFELARIALTKAEQDRELTRRGKITTAGSAVDSIIRAPAAGTILTRSVNPGDPVVPLTSYQPGTELATIAEMSDLIFKGTVDEIDVGKLHVGLVARIKVGALPTDVVTGKVARIAPQAQQKDGATLFDVEIELEPGQKVTLRAGYSANADLIIREKSDVVTVPERLVIFEDGGKKAFVEVPAASPKDPPKKVPVKLGISDGLSVEVLEGLKKGDKVVQRPPKEIS